MVNIFNISQQQISRTVSVNSTGGSEQSQREGEFNFLYFKLVLKPSLSFRACKEQKVQFTNILWTWEESFCIVNTRKSKKKIQCFTEKAPSQLLLCQILRTIFSFSFHNFSKSCYKLLYLKSTFPFKVSMHLGIQCLTRKVTHKNSRTNFAAQQLKEIIYFSFWGKYSMCGSQAKIICNSLSTKQI